VYTTGLLSHAKFGLGRQEDVRRSPQVWKSSRNYDISAISLPAIGDSIYTDWSRWDLS